MEHSILFAKIVNRYFERQQFFFRRRYFRGFDGGSVRIKGEKTCQSGRILYRNKCLRMASEKFVLASESNLSLVTELAS